MKHLLLILLAAGLMPATAAAQNYRVCLVDNKYTVCDKKTPTVHYTKKARTQNKATMASLREMDTHAYMGHSEPAPVQKTKSGMSIYYDDPNGAYQGKPTMVNDGVRKNKIRNVNYSTGNTELPPSDGGR